MTWERVTNCGSRTGGNAKGRLELRVLQWKFCVVRPGMRYASRLRFSNSDSCGWVVYANICLYWPAAGNAQHDGWESPAIRVFARQFVELRRNGMEWNRIAKLSGIAFSSSSSPSSKLHSLLWPSTCNECLFVTLHLDEDRRGWSTDNVHSGSQTVAGHSGQSQTWTEVTHNKGVIQMWCV